MGAGWGLVAWIGRFVKVALELRAKPRGLSRMIRCCCCVACLVCLVGQKVGICVLLTDRYRMCRVAFGGEDGVGGCGRRGAFIVVCLSPNYQCGLLRCVCYPAPRWGAWGGEEEQW